MDLSPVIQIIPALIGLIISALIFSYFFSKNNQNRKGIICSTLFFLVSPFLFQITIEHQKTVKEFFTDYKDVFSFPFITVLATALGILLGNTMLRLVAQRKEQKEIAILFINIIDAQIKCMGFINRYLSNLSEQNRTSIEYIRIYLSELSEQNSFETAFRKIGIYSETEIDLISRYSTECKQLITYIKRLLLYCETREIENGLNLTLRLQIVKISLVMTILLGYLCLIQMSTFYSSEKMNEYQQQFQHDFIEILNEFNSSVPAIINQTLYQDFRKRINLLKDKSTKIINPQIELDRNMYICIIQIDLETINQVCNTNFIEPSEVQNIKDFSSCSTIHRLLSSDLNIVSFRESEEDTRQNARRHLNSILSESMSIYGIPIDDTHIENLFTQLTKKVENISPWN